MNRKIFRGKAIKDYKDVNVKKDDWIYGNYIFSYRKKHLIYLSGKFGENSSYWIEVDGKTIGQFISKIKDLNKKEIFLFEGDIIQVVIETILGDILVNGIIEYDSSIFCYMVDFPNYGESRSLDQFIELGIKLIGNEIDNPELLDEVAQIN